MQRTEKPIWPKAPPLHKSAVECERLRYQEAVGLIIVELHQADELPVKLDSKTPL